MLEITQLASASGVLTKRISLADDGTLNSDGSACLMTDGYARRAPLAGIEAFAAQLQTLAPNQAIALGALVPTLPADVEITTRRRLAAMNGSAPPGLIARTAGHIAYRAGEPALALIDVDTKGMPQAVAGRVRQAGGFWAALVSVLPELAGVTRAVRTSTSSGITRTDTGQPVKGSNGVHAYLEVQDGADVERFLRVLHERCWLAGFGWMMVGAGGQMLERSLIDRMVYAAERLVFEAAPILEQPLWQDPAKRAPIVTLGEAAATRDICPDLTIGENARLRDLKAAEKHRLSGPADAARAAFIDTQAEAIAKRTGRPLLEARRAVERQCGGVLLSPVVLPFDAEDLEGATVADVLADPDRFAGATLADPLEGIAYGRCKAKVMRRPDGSLWINSFAHGRATYNLKHDFASVAAAVDKADPNGVTDLLVQLLLVSDLDPDQEQEVRSQVRKKTGVGARPLDAKIKAAKQERARERAKAAADARSAARTDKRLRVPVPLPDAERLPVLALLDEVLGECPDAVPPIRNLDGHPIEVRCRPPMLLHELSSEGSNQTEAPRSRLPAPSLPLLTKHDRHSLAHEIERHIEFIVEGENGERSVALPGGFVDHFMAYRDSVLPRVGAIVTAPLVLPDGTLLAPRGLDRNRKLVFQIEPALMPFLPDPAACTKTAAAAALDYLVGKWLCDVATDFSGKCVLITFALTILERALLPERPAFFVTAGKRGGGKTTAIMMVILAVTGKKPPAAAWSPSEEERRKAILAYLAEGLAAMVWDNIPLGTTIACPTIEKVLTAESYSDRVLGQSATITVPSLTVMSFTGNNIGPKGDLASRSLETRLEVDRIDPENRPFVHADPVAWTLENRGMILRALYTILLANPQLKKATRVEPKTRFKTWWDLVGSAVEHGAMGLVGKQASVPEADRYAEQIDFARLFAAIEGDDEEVAALADVLDVLDRKWPAMTFLASDVEKRAAADDDDAILLRSFFEEGRRSTTSASARTIGKRLSAVTGTPVRVGDHTLILQRLDSQGEGKSKMAKSFRVRRV